MNGSWSYPKILTTIIGGSIATNIGTPNAED